MTTSTRGRLPLGRGVVCLWVQGGVCLWVKGVSASGSSGVSTTHPFHCPLSPHTPFTTPHSPDPLHPLSPHPLPCEKNNWQTCVKTLPCPKLRLRAVKIVKRSTSSTTFWHISMHMWSWIWSILNFISDISKCVDLFDECWTWNDTCAYASTKYMCPRTCNFCHSDGKFSEDVPSEIE